MALLKQQLLELAENACKDSGVLSTAQMKDLLNLVLSSVQQTFRIALPTATADSPWKSAEWKSSCDKLKNSPRFKSSLVSKKICERIVRSCETPERQSKKKIPSKRSPHDTEEDVPHKSKKQRLINDIR